MPRISVSLPDELLERLEPVKGNLNVSQVCREALEKRLTAFERASVIQQPESLDLEGLINRLREERALAEGGFEQLGRRNAAAWLTSVPYLELKVVAGNGRAGSIDKYKLPHAAFRMMKRDMEEAKASCDGTYAVAYKTAWLDYVRAVWAEVVEKIEEDGRETELAGVSNGAEASE